MKIDITPKQLEILNFIYRYRFLNRIQIQTLLNNKNTKNINTWLKDLNDKKIIGRHYTRNTTENSKPAIYYLMTKSKNLLINQKEVNKELLQKRVYREKIKSPKLIQHYLLLANFYLNLIKNIREEKIHFFTKTDLINYDYFPTNCPDAYIVKEKETSKRYFLEIIDEGFPRFMIRKKIADYIEYYESKIWQEKTRVPFPSILILCPNQMIKKFIQKHLEKIWGESNFNNISIYSATTQEAFNGTWHNLAPEE